MWNTFFNNPYQRIIVSPLWLLIIITIAVVSLSGCGQGNANAEAETPAETAADAREEGGNAVAETGSQTEAPAAAPPAVPLSGEEMLALGEELFQQTAGGIGCQACHGRNALGDVGPNIVGKSAETIQIQLDANEAMQFIILSTEEVEAIAVYLDWLEGQQ